MRQSPARAGTVLSGTISRGSARDAARAAMECLALKQKAE
jgi:hypothetical protein